MRDKIIMIIIIFFLFQQLQNLKMEINKKKALIEEKKFFRQNEMENNKQLEDKITKVEKEGAKFRQEYQEAETQRTSFHDEVRIFHSILCAYLFVGIYYKFCKY